MAGTRYLADPQGGWLYLPPMALFSALSPAVAMRAFIVVNPLIAGFSMFAFLRIERLSRLSATLGGLSLAMLMSTSEIAISMPFAGSLAWTAVTLVARPGTDEPRACPAAPVDRGGCRRMVTGRHRSPQPRAGDVHGAGDRLPRAGAVADVRSGTSDWTRVSRERD